MRKILILEDQPESLTTLQAILEYRSYSTVIPASDPADAIRVCSSDRDIDLVVCDIVLRAPITGADAGAQIHGNRPGLPILFTSGTALEGLDERDFCTLCDLLSARTDFLQKPFTAGQLVSATDRLLAARAAPGDFARAIQRAREYRQSVGKYRPRVLRAGG